VVFRPSISKRGDVVSSFFVCLRYAPISHIFPIRQRRTSAPGPTPNPISAHLLLVTRGTTEVINGAGLEFTDVEVPEITDADVDFESVEDTEEAEVDDDHVDVDIEVVVKERMRTAAPISILRDVVLPLNAQAVVFAGLHHHEAGPSVEPLSGQEQGNTETSKGCVLTLRVSST
jgi:hypothetical protein